MQTFDWKTFKSLFDWSKNIKVKISPIPASIRRYTS
jgi:hypothetical protein